MITISYPIKIADLCDLAAQHGFRIERVTLDERHRLTAHIFANGLEIEFQESEQEMEKKAKPPVKLKAILQRMHSRAAGKPGEVVRNTLAGGLRLDLIVGIDGETRILVARKDVYPSATEWTVVLGHFPYDPPLDVLPERFEYKGWHCLRAAWDTPAADDTKRAPGQGPGAAGR